MDLLGELQRAEFKEAFDEFDKVREIGEKNIFLANRECTASVLQGAVNRPCLVLPKERRYK